MNITVTHTLAPEIISLFQGIIGSSKPKTLTSTIEVDALKATKQPAATPAASVAPVAAAPSVENAAATKITLEQLRLAAEPHKAKKDQVKALLAEFGATSISLVAETDRPALLERLNSL